MTIGSYGRGRATIAAPAESGVVIVDTGGVTIRDLIVKGLRAMHADDAGIDLYSDLPTGHMLSHVEISGVDVSGFGVGISIGGQHGNAGFKDVSVSGSSLHDNLDAGLESYGPPPHAHFLAYANADLRIDRVSAFRNRGNPVVTSVNTGSGVVLGSVRGAQVLHSTAYENGGDGSAANEGPIGIWTYDSADVVIAHDVSHDNNSSSSSDGGGFGLDVNTTHCFLQYDLSYHNHGSGFLLYGGKRGSSQKGNVVRFDVSLGDGRTIEPSGGLAVGGNVRDAAIYQNTVLADMSSSHGHAALKVWGAPSGVTVANNILVAAPGQPIVNSRILAPRSSVLMAGNDYFTNGGAWGLYWQGVWYQSLDQWRAATGQEVEHHRPTGYAVDPMLAAPLSGLTKAPTEIAQSPGALALRPGSALIHAGLDVSALFGLSPGPVTYAGTPVPAHLNVGAE